MSRYLITLQVEVQVDDSDIAPGEMELQTAILVSSGALQGAFYDKGMDVQYITPKLSKEG